MKEGFLKHRRALALGFISGAITYLMGGGFAFTSPFAWLVIFIPVFAAVIFAIWKSRREHVADAPSAILPVILAACAVVLLASNVATGSRFFVIGWWPDALDIRGLVTSGLFVFALLTIAMMVLLWLGKDRAVKQIVTAAAIILPLFCAAILLMHTGGAALYRDDHPSFMLRFWAFARSLPSPSFYNPFWNGGRIETTAISTGLQFPGLLFWPFWRFMPVHEVYTGIVAFIMAVLIPVMAAAGVRLAGGGRLAMAVAALLALNPSRFVFIWTLHYGTMPSGISSAFIMIICGALVYVFGRGETSRPIIPVLAFGLIGMAMWPPGAIFMMPVMLAVLLSARWWTAARFRMLVLSALVAGIFLLPGVWAVFQNVHVGKFVDADQHVIHYAAELQKGWNRILTHFSGSHPLIVFFGVFGVACIPRPEVRRICGITIAGLILLAGWGLMFKPVLQLNRAAIPLMYAAIIPAALWLEIILSVKSKAWLPLRAAMLSLLMVGAGASAQYLKNKGPAPYTIMNDDIKEVVAWIKNSTPPDSRVLFAGTTVHAYAGGHVAYLPVLTGRSMMACDYYHFSPKLVEYEYPPKAFRTNDASILRFLDLYNVSAVMTHHEAWVEFFRDRPELFQETGIFGPNRKRIGFRVLREAPGWFVEGSGEVKQSINRLDVRVDDPSRPVVLRFDWVNGLRADAPVKIKPVDVEPGVKFIGIDPGGVESFSLTWSQWRGGFASMSEVADGN